MEVFPRRQFIHFQTLSRNGSFLPKIVRPLSKKKNQSNEWKFSSKKVLPLSQREAPVSWWMEVFFQRQFVHFQIQSTNGSFLLKIVYLLSSSVNEWQFSPEDRSPTFNFSHFHLKIVQHYMEPPNRSWRDVRWRIRALEIFSLFEKSSKEKWD